MSIGKYVSIKVKLSSTQPEVAFADGHADEPQ